MVKINNSTLADLAPGSWAEITAVGGREGMRCRLLDMGFTPGTKVLLRKRAPLGDPLQLYLRGYEISIRAADARNIRVKEGV